LTRHLDDGLTRRKPDNSDRLAILEQQKARDAESREKAHALLASVHGWLWALVYHWKNWIPLGMDKDNLFQEFAINILRSSRHYHGRCTPKTWAAAVCRRALSVLRRSRLAKKRSATVVSINADDASPWQFLAGREADPAAAVIEREETAIRPKLIRRALDSLPPLPRFTIEATFGLGDGHAYTGEEVGSILGITRAGVSLHQQAGFAGMAAAMKGGAACLSM
jgi:RNA polymerase sigma factor (sigma-70 family)